MPIPLDSEDCRGEESVQLQSGHVLGSIMSKAKVEVLLDSPRMGFVGKNLANLYMQQSRKKY